MEPLIGIYWYHGEKLIVCSEPAAEVKVVEGFAATLFASPLAALQRSALEQVCRGIE